jgi:hypothetical protein
MKPIVKSPVKGNLKLWDYLQLKHYWDMNNPPVEELLTRIKSGINVL